MQHWLVKQEPEAYSWQDFVRDGRTAWTGVRNFQARNHLRSMRKGDKVFYYHSGGEKQIVGLAKVEREAYRDPTAEEGDWASVDLVPVRPLPRPVTLKAMRADKSLEDLPLLKQSRLSVTSLSQAQFRRVLQLGGERVK